MSGDIKSRFTRNKKVLQGGGVRYTCRDCVYQATSKREIIRHKEEIHGDAKFPPVESRCQSTTKSNLDQHQKGVHKKGVKYSCKECGYLAQRKYDLVQHSKSVHRGVKYSCTKCDFKSESKSSLVVHKKDVHVTKNNKGNDSEGLSKVKYLCPVDSCIFMLTIFDREAEASHLNEDHGENNGVSTFLKL